MKITLSGVKPYDGSYQLDFDDELTTREWGWIKRLSGYLPLALEDAAAGGDPEFACALAVIALHRAGRIDTTEVPRIFERLIDAPFGSAILIEVEDDETLEDADAGPPDERLNGSEPTSGDGSRTSSETSPLSLTVSGIPDSATSPSGPETSAG